MVKKETIVMFYKGYVYTRLFLRYRRVSVYINNKKFIDLESGARRWNKIEIDTKIARPYKVEIIEACWHFASYIDARYSKRYSKFEIALTLS